MLRVGQLDFSSGGFAPFMDAPDAGAGGGTPDPVGGGDGLPPSDVSTDPPAGDEPAVARTTTDDDDEDDDVDDDLTPDAEVTPERFKRVTAKLSKLKRRDRSFRVERGRLRELRAQGISLDDLIHGTRQHRELATQLARNPRLRELVSGDAAEEAGVATPRTREANPDPDPDFDDKSLPFDPEENDTNRYFATLARDNHGLKRTAAQLQKRLDAIEGKDTARTQAETQRAEAMERTTWKSVIDAAAAEVPEAYRNVFKDAMTSAYHNRKTHGKPPTFFVGHYLRGQVTAAQSKAASDAARKAGEKPATPAVPVRTAATQQRIAEANKTLPRTVAPNGTPAPARSGKESLLDVRRRLTGSKSRY